MARQTAAFRAAGLGAIAFACCLSALHPAGAQVIPDETLGAERSQVRPEPIRGIDSDRIDGGAVRGSSLFHSFEQFSVEAGRGAYFANPAGIETIFSRVTGDSPSNILGRLGVLGDANLFLINPNGILFGANASLDVGGSFVGTTANAIQFGDRGFFSASNPELPSALLTIDPSAFLFSQIPAPLTIGLSSTPPSGLQVADGNSLVLLGGETRIGGRLEAPGGQLELAAIAAPGTVGLAIADDIFRLRVPASLSRADLALTNAVLVTAAAGGGNIAIRANDLAIGQSTIQTGIAPNSGTAQSQSGDIGLDATGEISLLNSAIINRLETDALGRSGDIRIRANSLTLAGSSQIIGTGLAAGDTGDIRIQVANNLTLDGRLDRRFSDQLPTLITTSTLTEGDTGSISITAGTLTLNNSTAIFTSTLGVGRAGSITIRVRDAVSMRQSGIFSSIEPTGSGQAGNLDIEAGSLRLTRGARLAADASGQGDAGNIRIRTRGGLSLNGANQGDLVTSITTSANQGSAGDIEISAQTLSLRSVAGLFTSTNAGNSGDIAIAADRLSLADRAFITTNIFGSGNAGDIRIRVSDSTTLDGQSTISSSIESGAFGQAGAIEIATGSLTLDRAAIQSVVLQDSVGLPPGIENAGSITVRARGEVAISGQASGFYSANSSNGGSGDIQIRSRSLSLSDGAISTFTVGLPIFAGNQGEIEVGNADAGSVRIQSDDSIYLRGNSNVVTSSLFGNAGELTLAADSVIGFDDSNILAFSANGRGGNISLETPIFFGESYDPSFPPIINEDNAQRFADLLSNVIGEAGTPRVDINASGVLAGGEIAIPDVNFVQNSLVEVPETAIDTDQLLANSCIARSETGGTFLITGSDGLPERPGSSLTSPYPTGTVRSTPAAPAPAEGAIEEPENLYRLSDGRLVISRECG